MNPENQPINNAEPISNQQQTGYVQPAAVPSNTKKSVKPTASLILGIISFLGWIIPLIGFPVSITGLVLGILGLKSQKKGIAIAGIILCSIGLLATIVNSILGAYMGATGQLF